MKIKPRDYQKECLAQIAETVDSGAKRALVVMASSLGKTYTAAFAVERFFADRLFGRVLVLCHSEPILRQTKDKFKAYFGEEFSFGMYVNGDKTTRRTDFLFATFQTMKENRKDFAKDEFAYIIVDEAHHSKARTYFPTIRYFQPEFLLGLTATPDRLDGQKIEEIYGEPVYELGFVEATSRGLITKCDYRLVLDDLSQEKIDEYLQSNEKVSINQLNRTLFVPKRDEEIVRLVGEYSADVENPKTMIFCRTIGHARKIAKLMQGEDVALIHNDQSDSINRRALQAFRDGEIRRIISVQMLNEGVDVPDANVVVFLRNTVSPAVFYQQLGRGTRLAPDKDKTLVLDFVNNCERIKTVLELRQEIDDFKTYPPHGDEGTHGDGDADSKEKFTLNIATPEFKTKMIDIKELLDRTSNWRTASNQEYLDVLLEFAKELGRTPAYREVNNNPVLPSASGYVARFGTFNNAILLAGLEPFVRPGDDMDDSAMLNALKNFAEELGHTPSSKEVEANKKMPSAITYTSRFKTFRNALIMAGLKPNRKTPKDRKVQKELFRTEEDVIITLQKLYGKRDNRPTIDDLEENEQAPNYTTIRKFFSSLGDAFDAAGIVDDKVAPTKKEVIHLLQTKFHECGNRTPLLKEIIDDERFPSHGVIRRMFGGYNKLVIAAGLKARDYNSKRYSKDKIKVLLEDKAKEIGHWPSMSEINSDNSLPSTTTIRKRFGSTQESVIRNYIGTTN